MNNVLLIGNGFDLAHGLLTKYEHFLYLIKNWDEFYCVFEDMKNSKKKQKNKIETQLFIYESFGKEFEDFLKGPEKPIDKYLVNISKMDAPRIKQLGDIIRNNSWKKYYCNCEAEIDGWIDFEKEIYPVIDLFDFVFNFDYEIEYNRDNSFNIVIPKNKCSAKILKNAELWDKYIDVGPQNIYVKKDYVTKNYGILKNKILQELRREFDEFVFAFEIYLHEFVFKKENVKVLKQIKEIDADYVISFNYTLTEMLYDICEKNVHHIHGMMREDLSFGKNNMVAGVREKEMQNMDFIYFVKYFQRIQKNCGVRYKKFISIEKQNKEFEIIHQEYKLFIYGHSLDETDEDILKYIIGYKDEKGKLILKPKKVVIFVYDDFDYEQKVINLIKLYGRSIVEEYIENKYFDFIQTNCVECNNLERGIKNYG